MTDIIDGREVPSIRVNTDTEISGQHRGSVEVLSGKLSLSGSLHGSLAVPGIRSGYNRRAARKCDARVVVFGIHGSVRVQSGAVTIIEEGGKLAGSLHNQGTVFVRGIFGGAHSGQGRLIVEGPGTIKKPAIRKSAFHEHMTYRFQRILMAG